MSGVPGTPAGGGPLAAFGPGLTQRLEQSFGPYVGLLYTFLPLITGRGLPYFQYPMPFGELTPEDITQSAAYNAALMRLLQELPAEPDVRTRRQLVLGVMAALGADVDDPSVQRAADRIARHYGGLLDVLGMFFPQHVGAIHGLKGSRQSVAMALAPYLARFYPNRADIDTRRISRTVRHILDLAPMYGFSGDELARMAAILHEQGVARLDEPERIRNLLPRYARVFAAARYYLARATGRKDITDPTILKTQVLDRIGGDWARNPDSTVEKIMGLAGLAVSIGVSSDVLRAARERLDESRRRDLPWTDEIYRRLRSEPATAGDVQQLITTLERQAPQSYEGRLLGALVSMYERGRIGSRTLRAALHSAMEGHMVFKDPVSGRRENVLSVLAPERLKHYLSGNEMAEARMLAASSQIMPRLRKYPHLTALVPAMAGDRFRHTADLLSRFAGGPERYALLSRLAQQYGFPDLESAVFYTSPAFREAYAREMSRRMAQARRETESLRAMKAPNLMANLIETVRRMGEKAEEPGRMEGPFGIWGTLWESVSPVYPELPEPTQVPEVKVTE